MAGEGESEAEGWAGGGVEGFGLARVDVAGGSVGCGVFSGRAVADVDEEPPGKVGNASFAAC